MSRSRVVVLALAPFLLHAFARELDRGLGLVLRSELAPAGLLGELARACAADGPAALARILAWVAAGAIVSLLLAVRRARIDGTALPAAPARVAPLFTPLLLRPAVTLVALVAVAVEPSYPYGFTLAVALTQDWAIGQDAATLATLLALVLPPPRVPAPRTGNVFLIAFLAYALLVPGWAWFWGGHPGNEPKYLRQAVALGHGLSFDAEGVSAAMEDLPTEQPARALGAAVATVVRESGRMAVALARGEAGRDAIRATRITRQTVRGKQGGVYYVLAPGPSLVLAPALRVDRALNLARGTKGRIATSVLVFCALGALLVGAVFSLVRDATARPGLAAALAFGFALVPPFLFYSFQFYPEMPAALVLAFAWGTLTLRPERLLRHPWLFGWAVALLPWLHQKFLPVWAAVVVTAAWVVWRQARRPGLLAALAVPQAVTLYLTALYNFAITGSVRPDALFLAWGPAGVTSARVGQGLLGLWLDARYGLLPYVPALAIGLAALRTRGARRLAIVLPSALVYYLTVASADNWAGAVCNLGRYLMPLVPLGVALVGIALSSDRGAGKVGAGRGGVALFLVLAAWTALFAIALRHDPHAANDSALLLAKSTYAEGNQYLPNLFLRHWSDAAPGLWARIGAWALALALIAVAVRRAVSPQRTLAGMAVVILALGFSLERWPAGRVAPSFANALPAAGGGGLIFLDGAVELRGDQAIVGPGRVAIVRRTYARSDEQVGLTETPLRATIGGNGLLRLAGRTPFVLRPTGGVVDLPLMTYHVLLGEGGRIAVLSRLQATVSGQAVMHFRGNQQPAGPAPAIPDQDTEPNRPGLR